MRIRIGIISPLRGTPSQLAEVEERIKPCDPGDVVTRRIELRFALLQRNMERARELCREVAREGFAPYASHLHCTAFLRDTIEEERNSGLDIGRAFYATCSEAWVDARDGISSGMQGDIDFCIAHHVNVIVKWK